MHIVKMIGMIFLAIYLILAGLSQMSEINLAPVAKSFLDLVAVTAGVLILISIGRCIPHQNPKV